MGAAGDVNGQRKTRRKTDEVEHNKENIAHQADVVKKAGKQLLSLQKYTKDNVLSLLKVR